MNKKKKTVEDELYIIGIIALAVIAVGSIFLIYADSKGIKLPPCFFNLFTGLYCPGCGGTRAVRALLHGHILKALWYHPFVVYGVIMYIVFMVTNTIRIYIYPGFRSMKYKNIYLYIWIAILILNFLVKNILLIKFGISLN